jgi:hypothetical protein
MVFLLNMCDRTISWRIRLIFLPSVDDLGLSIEMKFSFPRNLGIGQWGRIRPEPPMLHEA